MIGLKYPFTQEEFKQAADEWGCNCGPSSLAFALQSPLDRARSQIPGFDEKRYTSPAMMRQALDRLAVAFNDVQPPSVDEMWDMRRYSLVRIQWAGPWTEPGANPKWAYRQTHWIATTPLSLLDHSIFDCNAGIVSWDLWTMMTVPFILKHVPRANGKWWPTHIWRLP
jgi:hypothetical protein